LSQFTKNTNTKVLTKTGTKVWVRLKPKRATKSRTRQEPVRADRFLKSRKSAFAEKLYRVHAGYSAATKENAEAQVGTIWLALASMPRKKTYKISILHAVCASETQNKYEIASLQTKKQETVDKLDFIC